MDVHTAHKGNFTPSLRIPSTDGKWISTLNHCCKVLALGVLHVPVLWTKKLERIYGQSKKCILLQEKSTRPPALAPSLLCVFLAKPTPPIKVLDLMCVCIDHSTHMLCFVSDYVMMLIAFPLGLCIIHAKKWFWPWIISIHMFWSILVPERSCHWPMIVKP